MRLEIQLCQKTCLRQDDSPAASNFTLTRVPRAQNTQADALAKLASGLNSKSPPPEVEQLPWRTIAAEDVVTTDTALTWIEEILSYKMDETLSIDKVATRRLWHM